MAESGFDHDDFRATEFSKLEVREKTVRVLRVDSILRLYVAMGFLIAALALIYFGFSFLNITLRPDQQAAIAVAGVGLAISLLSAVYLLIRRQHDTLQSEAYQFQTYDRDIVREWARFESLGRSLLEKHGVSFNTRSPRAIIVALAANKLIPPEEANDIQRALDVRNKVVHEAEVLPSAVLGIASSVLLKSNKRLEAAIYNGDAARRPRPIVLED